MLWCLVPSTRQRPHKPPELLTKLQGRQGGSLQAPGTHTVHARCVRLGGPQPSQSVSAGHPLREKQVGAGMWLCTRDLEILHFREVGWKVLDWPEEVERAQGWRWFWKQQELSLQARFFLISKYVHGAESVLKYRA